MRELATAALYAWPIFVLLLFAVLRPRWSVAIAFVTGTLFLPLEVIELSGLPDYGKFEATSLGVLVGVLLFDGARVGRYRVGWVDLPAIIFCLSPMASSLANGLGVYDGASNVLTATVVWGLPYLFGRLYFGDLHAIRDLAVAVFVGGLVYLPFCVWEMRMSPRLHLQIYGFRQHSFRQHERGGGYRPMVFMQHGLAVALWMASATLVGLWLRTCGVLRRLWRVPVTLCVSLLGLTTVFCRSFGAAGLMIIGAVALLLTRWTRSRWVVGCLLLLPALYLASRATGVWDGSHLLDATRATASQERVESLNYRLVAENVLSAHARRRPIFGWGGWNRNRPPAERDGNTYATDGLWIITFGQRGSVGLFALVGLLLLPPFLLWRLLPVSGWWHAATAPACAVAVVSIVFMIDSLFNAMYNPVYLLACGGLTSVAVTVGRGDGLGSQERPRSVVRRRQAVPPHATRP